jgi:predicted nucleotide-binding protein (sugar kinase/HSP70/actin superfamily)
MGDMGSKMLAAALRRQGVRATAAPSPGSEELKIGKGHATCKECLPLILTVGSLLGYLEKRADPGELLVYFMPTSSGPCRFGQYNVLINNLIRKLQIQDVAQISLSCENSYAGLGSGFSIRAFQAVIISDVLEEIYSAILTIARDKERSLQVYNQVCAEIIDSVEKDGWKELKEKLRRASRALEAVEVLQPLEETPKVALVGEIYVRRDGFSRQYLVEKLAQKGIMVKAAPVAEWIYYCDYLIKNNLSADTDKKGFIGTHIEKFFKKAVNTIRCRNS